MEVQRRKTQPKHRNEQNLRYINSYISCILLLYLDIIKKKHKEEQFFSLLDDLINKLATKRAVAELGVLSRKFNI